MEDFLKITSDLVNRLKSEETNIFWSNPLIFFSAGAGGRGGKREFDRKSGDTRTGIKAEEKRGGSGKGNWGNFEDDVKVGVSHDLSRHYDDNLCCDLDDLYNGLIFTDSRELM